MNNAGYSHRNKQFSDVTAEEFDKVYYVNVKAVFIAIQEALPVLRERDGGCIINTSHRRCSSWPLTTRRS